MVTRWGWVGVVVWGGGGGGCVGGGSGGGGGVTGVGRGSVLQMSFLYHGFVQPQSKYG